MKNFKYTIPGQMTEIVKTHGLLALVFIVFGLVLASFLMTKVGSIFYGALGFMSYTFSIYNTACGCALRDKRPSSRLAPRPAKGFILPAILLALNVAVIILYKLAWSLGGDGQYLNTLWAVVLNVLSITWFSPLDQVLGMGHGNIELLGYILIFVLPVIASGAGYFAGYKDIDIYGKISSIAYEKTKK